MTSRQHVRIRAAGIARGIGAPVEPCTYLVSLPGTDTTTTEDKQSISQRMPIERGPFVAFDGYYVGAQQPSGDEGFGEPITMRSGNRPLVWQNSHAQNPDYVGPSGGYIFPAVRGIGDRGPSNLDGWPAPVFIGAGEEIVVTRLQPTSLSGLSQPERTLAFTGFHTSRVAWLAIAAQLGEVRFWTVGQSRETQGAYPAGADEMPARESVEVIYAYNDEGGFGAAPDGDARDVHIENRRLAISRDYVQNNSNTPLQLLGLPQTSSPASVIGPRPLVVGGTVVQQWLHNSSEVPAPLRITFVGVTHDNF